MSVSLTLLVIWLVALPSIFLVAVAVYPRYLRHRMGRPGAVRLAGRASARRSRRESPAASRPAHR